MNAVQPLRSVPIKF